ncbi:MAG: LysR family transcriptional regulator [Serratia sp. (in: enterobacteria)]|uniref:LysR family transcriptional regulator n=1 Tax=Serratia sp. (in: enterobacteria) TaxID=616 RepID=UPI003F3AA330
MGAVDRFDYNLIKTLILVFETKSMGAAARALGISAPTLSYSLNKIRQYYNDPLFIKTAQGLKATPIAQELYPQYKNIEKEFNRILTVGEGKKLDVRKVRIRSNTLIEYFLMDKVLQAGGLLEGVCIEFNNKTLTEEQRVNTLVSRECDIDIGQPIRSDNSLTCTPLFSTKFVALCNAEHPRVEDTLTAEQWLAEEHALVSLKEGVSYWPIIFHEMLASRKIRYVTSSLLNIFHCLEDSEMLTIIPEYFTATIQKKFALRSATLPWLDNELIDIYAYTHSRDKDDEKLKMIINTLTKAERVTK